MTFWNKHKGWILNILAGVVSGGVFTAPVLIAAAGSVAGKLAASPLNHS